jgi:hypothetical protein
MYQNPPRFPPVPTPHELPRSPRRRPARFMMLLTLFALMFFGSAYVVSPEPAMFQVRLAAVDPATGDVLAIAMDQTRAARVDAPTAAVWSGRLSTEPSSATPAKATGVDAVLNPGPPERITLRQLPFGIPGSQLVRLPPDGWPLPVGGTAFHDGRLVIAGGTAAGAATGHVLVEHRRSRNDAGITLSMVSLDAGQVTGSLALESSVEHAVTGPDGTTAVAARQVLAVATAVARQVVDLTDLAAVQPDAILPVRYLPDNRVVLATDAPTHELQAALDRVHVTKGWLTQEQLRITEYGVDASAVVLGMTPTGHTPDGRSELRLGLRVTRPDGSTFDVTQDKKLPPASIPRCSRAWWCA